MSPTPGVTFVAVPLNGDAVFMAVSPDTPSEERIRVVDPPETVASIPTGEKFISLSKNKISPCCPVSPIQSA